MLLSATSPVYLNNFTKNNNIFTNLNEQFPHTDSGTGVPGSGVGTPDGYFQFDPTPSAVAAAGYAPNYVTTSNAVNNGVQFTLSADGEGHDFDQIDSGTTTSILANVNHVQTVYALMSAYDGVSFNVTFTGADGTSQTFSNVQLPDFNGGSINTTGDGYTDQTVFQVNDVGAGGSGSSVTGDTTNYGLTEVGFTLEPSLANQQLSTIAFTSNGYETLLLGVTVEQSMQTTTNPVKSIGGLDPGFGSDGLASHDVGFTSTNGVATQGANSILIGPIGTSPNQVFGVTRYLADGSLDTSFGTDGVATVGFTGLDAVPTAVLVQSDGSIIVGGTATTFTDGVASGSEFAITKLSADGVVDPTLNQLLLHFSTVSGKLSDDTLKTLVAGPNGVIYAGGTTDGQFKGDTDFAIAAIEQDGTLDPNFYNGAGATLLDLSGGDDVLGGLAVQSNGDLVAAGSSVVNGAPEVSITRLLPSGQYDKKFGIKGVVTDGVGGVYDAATSVLIQPKGQIVIGGLTAVGSGDAIASDFLLQRYTSTGRLDRTFGNGGTVTTPFDQVAAVTQLALQSDGSIVASGRTSTTLGGTLDLAVARYTSKGSLDTSFNGTGKVIVDLGSGIVPAAASSLGAAFDAFVSSEQGTVNLTQGGEILTAGSSGANTVEAELIAAGVDLVTKVLSALPASVLAGAKGKVSVTITESGTTAAKGSVTIAVSFATDASGVNASTPLNFDEKVSLKQGVSKTFKLNFTFPTGLASGDYFLFADVTNGTGVPADLNTANNTAAAAAATTIAPAFVTLSGANLATASITPGKTVTISIDLTNTGNVTAKGRTEIDLYLSTDTTVADGVSLGVAPLTVSLAADKSKTYKLKVPTAATLPAGTFNLLGVIDPNNSLGNGDTSNVLVVDATPVTVG